MVIPNSELILNADGSIYHLHLQPEQLASTIITVGDPERVSGVSQYFDRVTDKVQHREFVTHTGELRGERITVISTGIGTDNIDIVLNELDALVNIDLATRTVKPQLTALRIIRIGTSGCLQADVPIDSFVASSYGLGLDSLMDYYDYEDADYILLDAFVHGGWDTGALPFPYLGIADADLLAQIAQKDILRGITATCGGFYAPQGRHLRIKPYMDNFLPYLSSFRYKKQRITNLEMETAGIYALANVLGHKALSVSALLANRMTNEFSVQPDKTVDKLIRLVLERLV